HRPRPRPGSPPVELLGTPLPLSSNHRHGWSTAPERRHGYPATPLGTSRTCRVVSLHPSATPPRINAAHRIGGDTSRPWPRHRADRDRNPPAARRAAGRGARPVAAGGHTDRRRAPLPAARDHGRDRPRGRARRAGLPAGGARAARGARSCGPAARVLRMAHVELFVRGRAVLLPAGIGIAPPAATSAGQVL